MTYPNSIDSFTTKTDGADDVEAAHMNAVQSAIVNIETALGTNPEGNSTDVAERLDALESGVSSIALPSGEPATDDTGYGIIETVTVDTNAVGAGAVLCLASDGNYDEADADAIATMKGLVLALESGTGSKKVLRYGKFRHDAWAWTAGDIVYVSVTQGTLSATPPNGADDVIKAVGVALTDDMIFFNPTETYITHTG